jgi:hypothetical protein
LPFCLNVNGQAELGNWKDAEQANLQVVRTAPTYQYSERAYENLTGIYAVQRQWPRAIASFGHWIGNDLLHLACPKLLVCLAWLILWQLGTDIPSRPRISRRALPLLVLFALCSIFSVVFETVAICLNSYLFTGNAGAAIVSTRTREWVTIAVVTEWGGAFSCWPIGCESVVG